MMTPDALAPRLARLAAEHRSIDSLIREASQRAAPDFAHISALKRRKLAIKDSLAFLSKRAGSSLDGLSA